MDWAREFPGLRHGTYLNSCAHGLLPERARLAIEAHLRRWSESPDWTAWNEEIESARLAFARLIHARPEEVALVSSAGAGMAAVMTALPREGARRGIVTLDLDFPTSAALAARQRGMRHTHVPGDKSAFDERAWLAALGTDTALACVPAVASFSGRRFDIARLAREAHTRGAMVLVDAFQACGTYDIDVRALDVDFLVTGVYKWLLAPPGLAFLYVRRDHHALEPQTAGWLALDEPYAFDPLGPLAPDARRFQTGGASISGCVGAVASLKLLEEVGLREIERRNGALAQRVIDHAQARGWEVLTPRDPAERASIVTFRGFDLARALDACAREGIVVNPRLGGLRVSPHFYNTADDVDRLFAALDA